MSGGQDQEEGKAGGYGTFQGPHSYPPPRPPPIGFPQPVPPPAHHRAAYRRAAAPPGSISIIIALARSASFQIIKITKQPSFQLPSRFIVGFFLGAIPWYVGAILLWCSRVDHREKPGYVACTIAAVLATIVVIIGATAGAHVY
ncbi:hypothetical protein C2845_PM07G40550 [Panicum miliaceum]|uniref:60S ribosomal protein L18a-like protein n=1 Tax=Panicum miliaceum TaxID=4540 RepID=A0A3L6SSL2_PANMI|nr:hypothetical protein C2845_PM07G40550 [Panicum miliaceum]